MKLKKGSAAAKSYMAKIRAKKDKKTTPKKVSGVLNTLKRKAVSAKKELAYSVIDKTLKNSTKKTTKDVLNRAKAIIKNTYIGESKKVGIVKKPFETTHKDTKSHNVNIRVISGINDSYLKSLEKAIKRKEDLEDIYKRNKSIPLKERTATNKIFLKDLPKLIKNEKEIIAQLKRYIK